MNMKYSYPTTMYESMFSKMYIFQVEKYSLQFLLTSSVRGNYCMDSNILFIHCSQKTVVQVQVNILSKIHQACHNDVNGFKPGSNWKMTEKHAAEY